MGNVIKEIDALGNSTSYTYSLGGKLTSVLDAMGSRTEYGYDKAGRLATVYRHEGSRELLSCIEDEERKHSLKEISKTKEKYGREISESLKEANVLRITSKVNPFVKTIFQKIQVGFRKRLFHPFLP